MTGAGAAVEFNEPRLSRNLRLVELLREIGSGHGVSQAWWLWPGRCTIRPSLRQSWAGAAGEQVEGLAPALDFRLSDEEFATDSCAFLAANPV